MNLDTVEEEVGRVQAAVWGAGGDGDVPGAMPVRVTKGGTGTDKGKGIGPTRTLNNIRGVG